MYGGHTKVRVDGTDEDGPREMEIAFNDRAQTRDEAYSIKVIDLGIANTGKPIPPDAWYAKR